MRIVVTEVLNRLRIDLYLNVRLKGVCRSDDEIAFKINELTRQRIDENIHRHVFAAVMNVIYQSPPQI